MMDFNPFKRIKLVKQHKQRKRSLSMATMPPQKCQKMELPDKELQDLQDVIFCQIMNLAQVFYYIKECELLQVLMDDFYPEIMCILQCLVPYQYDKIRTHIFEVMKALDWKVKLCELSYIEIYL